MIRYSNTSLAIIGFGLIATIAFAVIFNYSRSAVYPKLSSQDSLNDLVASVKTDRGIAFVTFNGNKKYEIPWAKNFQYEEFTTLSSIISPGDVIFKKAFSDTLRVGHEGKEYIYVLSQTIGQ
jgi:hypothetical protein